MFSDRVIPNMSNTTRYELICAVRESEGGVVTESCELARDLDRDVLRPTKLLALLKPFAPVRFPVPGTYGDLQSSAVTR